jgi:peptidyl-prolyl cis-trans isomerase SurA
MNVRACIACVACLGACAPSQPSEPQPPAPAAPSAAPAPAPAPAAPSAAAPAANPDEACGQIIVVAYKGAAHVKPGVTRSKSEAQKRARDLLARLQTGVDFGEVAKSESDAPSSAPRGGVMGTFAKADWPDLHKALRDPLFALGVGQTAPQPVDADYGYVLLRRCPVQKAHARHILVRYKGAKNAEGVTRDKAAAEKRANELLAKLQSGADFAEIGSRGRGVLALPFEHALFALKPGERSGVVESEFGFHIIERLPD